MSVIYGFLESLPLSMFQYDFMKNAFLAAVLIAPLFALLGTMAVNNKMAFFSDALGHSAFTGIGLGVLLGLDNPILAMLAFGIFLSLVITKVKAANMASSDTIISVFSSSAMALGIVILSGSGGFSKYSSYLIGDILTVSQTGTHWGVYPLGSVLQSAASAEHQPFIGCQPWRKGSFDGKHLRYHGGCGGYGIYPRHRYSDDQLSADSACGCRKKRDTQRKRVSLADNGVWSGICPGRADYFLLRRYFRRGNHGTDSGGTVFDYISPWKIQEIKGSFIAISDKM